jgi:hypothetical protein
VIKPTTIKHNSRGSVYLVTLITVAAIASMVMIGMTLRSATSSKSTLIEEMSKTNTDILNAAELTLQTVQSDTKWKTTAQSGVALPKQTINGITYASTVKDADTDTTPTDTTTNYTLMMSATQDSIQHVSELTINYDSIDYEAYVDDLSAEFYWPLTEPEKSANALEPISSNNGVYLDSNSGAGTNDEGAPVPVFANSSDQVSVPWDSKFKQGRGSLSCWIKYTGPSNDYSVYPFIGMNYQSGGHPSLNISIFNTAVWAYTSDDGVHSYGRLAFTSSGAVKLNTWHHITITWGGSGGLMIYIDGALAGQNASNTLGIDTASKFSGGEQPLFLGSGYDIGSGSTPRKGFLGSLCHVVLYDNELTADEISDLAEIRPDEAFFGLVADSWTTVYPD